MVEQCPINFKGTNQNYQCNICKKEELTQEHLLTCKELIWKNKKVTYIPNHEQIFSENLNEQI